MHEVALANQVLAALRRLAAENKAVVLRANLRVGELNEPSRLRYWLNTLGGDEFKGVKFKISPVALTISCRCGYSGKIRTKVDAHSPAPELEIKCPECGGQGIEITSGRELEIVDVELGKK